MYFSTHRHWCNLRYAQGMGVAEEPRSPTSRCRREVSLQSEVKAEGEERDNVSLVTLSNLGDNHGEQVVIPPR